MTDQSNNNVSEEVMLRDVRTGRWIKRSDKETALSSNLVPSSLITINNNVINYTDTNKIIEKIAKERKESRVVFLEDRFNKIVDSLDNYRAYGSGIEKVFDACESHAGEFDNRIRAIASDFDYEFKYNNENSVLLNISSAYLKILFSYIFSSFVLHKSKVKNETVIYTKLLSFKDCLQSIFEKILIPNSYHGDIVYSRSMYSLFIFGSMDIFYINELIKYDRRFENELILIKSHNKSLITKNNREYPNEVNLSVKFYQIENGEDKWNFINSLRVLLCDIDNLISIRDEIGNIEDETVFIEYENNINNG